MLLSFVRASIVTGTEWPTQPYLGFFATAYGCAFYRMAVWHGMLTPHPRARPQ